MPRPLMIVVTIHRGGGGMDHESLLLLGCPSDPAVAGSQFESARLPANQGQPGFTEQSDMTKTLADGAVEIQIVMFSDQAVPKPVFIGTIGRTYDDEP